MTDITVAKLILVPVMGKRNQTPFATRKFDFCGALIFNRGTT